MKLRRLRISNCSRIKDLDIEVQDNLVLIGPNGSGKTTVLLCLDILLGMDDENVRQTVSESFVRDESQPFSVEATFGKLGEGERAVFPDAVEASTGELLVKLEVRMSAGGGKAVANSTRYFPSCATRTSLTQAQREAFGWTLLLSQGIARDARRDHLSIVDEVHELASHGTNVLAIDEPEAHLHPSSQRSLTKTLKASESQKILVTHSPTIAGSFEPDEIVVICADGSAAQPEEGFLSGEAGMVARWWVGRQLEPLTAGTVIAVEGPSDRIIVNKVASALGYDLDRNDAVVIETDGCGNMKVVESIFGTGGFNIPLYELVDEDAVKDVARRAGANPEDPSDLARHRVFVSTSDLEDEYVRAIGARKLWDKIVGAGLFSKTVLSLCELEADGYPTEENLAEFIRSKTNRKIPTALAATTLIDASNAHEVDSVARLLTKLHG